jgi:hypothetical protein
MTPEERQMLTDLANKVAQTPAPPVDPEAQELIRSKIGSRPDALYLMTQTVLIQNLALDHAKQQIQELQQQVAQGGTSSSPQSGFLGGSNPPPAPRGPAPSYGSGGYGGYSAAPPPPPPPPPSYYPPSAPAPASGGGSSFLRGAAQTAAGVAAGALAFEGIRSLFGGIEHMAGFGQPSSQGFGGFTGGGMGPGSETVINNYYDQPAPGSGGDSRDFVDPSDDSANYDASADDNTTDDSSNDDSGSYDDSSNYDDNSSSDDSV